MRAHNLKNGVENIPNLTPLRGFAAMAVVLFHFNEILVLFVTQELTMLLRKCYLMVDLFFIMSGFIMLHVYGASFTNSIQQHTFWTFIKARFARLYPLHLFTLIASVVLFYSLSNATDSISSRIYNPNAIVTNLFMLHACGVHDIFTWNVPAWSISAEWWAYMVFPFLALLLAKNKRLGAIIIGVMVVILYCAIVYFLPRINPFVPTIPNLNHDLDVTYDYGYLRGIAGFMIGMLTYVAYSKEKIVHLFTGDTIALVTILVLLVSMHLGWNDLVYIPLFVLLVLCFSSNEGKLALLCAQKPLQYLGDISYSIYMVHGLMLFFAGDFYLKLVGITFKEGEMRQIPFLSGLWSSLLFLGLVIGISSITYYGIEKPCRKWLNRKMN